MLALDAKFLAAPWFSELAQQNLPSNRIGKRRLNLQFNVA